MDPLIAELTVAEVEARLAESRARIISLPPILVALAAVDIGGAVAAVVIGRDHLLAYFLLAQTVALSVAITLHRRQARQAGAQAAVWPWLVTAAGVTAAAAAMSRLGFALDSDPITSGGPLLAYALGYLVLARWARSRTLTAAALAMPLVTLLMHGFADGDVAVAGQLACFGVILLVVAFVATSRRSEWRA